MSWRWLDEGIHEAATATHMRLSRTRWTGWSWRAPTARPWRRLTHRVFIADTREASATSAGMAGRTASACIGYGPATSGSCTWGAGASGRTRLSNQGDQFALDRDLPMLERRGIREQLRR
jgi:hypothetical protein